MDDAFIPIPVPRVVYEGDGVVVVAKPAGMHCAPAAEGEAGTLCAWLFGLFPHAAAVHGWKPLEGGLLHRLDSATSGLVAFATTDDAFVAMSRAATAGAFVKTYRAFCLPGGGGLPGSRPELSSPSGYDRDTWMSAVRRGDAVKIADMIGGTAVESLFRPYGPGAARVACSSTLGPSLSSDGVSGRLRDKKAWTRDSYRTDIVSASARDGGVLAELTLSRGFRHQIRAHMAWMGLPLYGDPLYGEGGGELHLRAFRMSFPGPRGADTIIVDLDACQYNDGPVR